MPESVQALTANYNLLNEGQKKQFHDDTGLTTLDRETKRGVWVGIFILLGLGIVGALLLILRSYSIDITTTSGTGASAVTAVTHPDVSAAWALASAVIAGIVGLLAPTPIAKN